MTARWDLPSSDLRVRLADVLEAWAPGGMECHDLSEMDVLLHLLDTHGVRVTVAKVKVRYLAQDGDCKLTFTPADPEWPYACVCGRWSAHTGGDLIEAKDRWRAHVRQQRPHQETA